MSGGSSEKVGPQGLTSQNSAPLHALNERSEQILREHGWSVVARHYREDGIRQELLRNKRVENGKVVGDLLLRSGDRESLQWVATNHNNDLRAAVQAGQGSEERAGKANVETPNK